MNPRLITKVIGVALFGFIFAHLWGFFPYGLLAAVALALIVF
jgi:hypothetical protein